MAEEQKKKKNDCSGPTDDIKLQWWILSWSNQVNTPNTLALFVSGIDLRKQWLLSENMVVREKNVNSEALVDRDKIVLLQLSLV